MIKITDTELELVLEYATKKKELLENIYDITSRRKFLGEESEIDEFVEYLDIREPYYEQLAELNAKAGDKLRDFEIDFDNNNGLYREVSQLLSNSKDIATRIFELDKENNCNMQKVYEKLMLEVRNISASKKARNSYNFFQAQSGDNK